MSGGGFDGPLPPALPCPLSTATTVFVLIPARPASSVYVISRAFRRSFIRTPTLFIFFSQCVGIIGQ